MTQEITFKAVLWIEKYEVLEDLQTSIKNRDSNYNSQGISLKR